jgi:hypothetical protein
MEGISGVEDTPEGRREKKGHLGSSRRMEGQEKPTTCSMATNKMV